MPDEKIKQFPPLPSGVDVSGWIVGLGEPTTGEMYQTSFANFKALISASNPAPPRVNAGPNKVLTLPENSTVLIGFATPITGRYIVSYQWTQISGPTGSVITSPTAPSTGIGNLQAGNFVYRLSAIDNRGGTDSSTVTVSVAASAATPAQPTVNAGPDISIDPPIDTATLTGTASAPGGTITNYTWSKQSGPTGGNIVTPGNPVTEVNTLTSGLYVFRLTVTHSNGQAAFDEVNVLVTGGDPIPPAGDSGLTEGDVPLI
jgi:hypothetical protein